MFHFCLSDYKSKTILYVLSCLLSFISMKNLRWAMMRIHILLDASFLPFCTPVLIGPQVVPLPSFNKFSVGSEIKRQIEISLNLL